MEQITFKWQRQILESDLEANGKLIMLAMSIYMNPDGTNCFPSVSELQIKTGLSRNTVKKYIRLAIKKKILRAENAGFRGSKSEQLKYYPIVNQTGGQPLTPYAERGSTTDPLKGERGSTIDQRGSIALTPTKSLPNKKTFSSDSVEIRLSEKLFSLIQKRNPKHKKEDLQKWGVHIDRLIRINNRTPEEIEKVIEWCQSDSFWKNNILSTDTLRKKFDKLFLKMGENSPESKPYKPTGLVT